MVDIENIGRRLAENAAKAVPLPMLRVIATASQEVRSGIVYATMIVVLVFVPLFALTGIEGRLFAPLGVAYIVAILASLVVSITLTPVMASFLMRGGPRSHADTLAGAPAEARQRPARRRGAAVCAGSCSASPPLASLPLYAATLSAAHVPAALQRGHADHQHDRRARASRSPNRAGSAPSPNA